MQAARAPYAVPYLVSTVTPSSRSSAVGSTPPAWTTTTSFSTHLGSALADEFDLLRGNALHLGLEADLDSAGGARLLEALPVGGLDPIEHLAPVGKHHGRSGLRAARERALDRAVSPAHDQNALAPILFRLDQPVDDLRHLLPRHVELARRSPPADRKKDVRRLERSLRRLDLKAAFDSSQSLHARIEIDLQARICRRRPAKSRATAPC